MQFIHSAAGVGQDKLSNYLKTQLHSNRRVLWLIPGGSNIDVAVEVMESLIGIGQNLMITLTDERYGPVGHKDSNWKQLRDAGFNPGKAAIYPVLQDDLSLAETASKFAETMRILLGRADIIVGQFGIGTDGHIAGVLPGSAASLEMEQLAVGYETNNFTRVTLTFPVLQKVTTAFCFVYGADKREALQNLQSDSLPLTDQPAQILQKIGDVFVYNDQIGDVI